MSEAKGLWRCRRWGHRMQYRNRYAGAYYDICTRRGCDFIAAWQPASYGGRDWGSTYPTAVSIPARKVWVNEFGIPDRRGRRYRVELLSEVFVPVSDHRQQNVEDIHKGPWPL